MKIPLQDMSLSLSPGAPSFFKKNLKALILRFSPGGPGSGAVLFSPWHSLLITRLVGPKTEPS